MDTDQTLVVEYIQNHTDEALLQIEKLDYEDIANLINSLPEEIMLLLLSRMESFRCSRTMEKMDINLIVKLIEKLPLNRSRTLLRHLNDEVSNEILKLLHPRISKSLGRILKFPDNTVGANLDLNVLILFVDISVGDALDIIKKHELSPSAEIFIVERNHVLSGAVELSDLISSEGGTPIRSIMKTSPPKLFADRFIDDLVEGKGWIEPYTSLPVVDQEDMFLGVLKRETLSNIILKKESIDRYALQASNALGDLYRIGLSGLFKSAVDLSSQSQLK